MTSLFAAFLVNLASKWNMDMHRLLGASFHQYPQNLVGSLNLNRLLGIRFSINEIKNPLNSLQLWLDPSIPKKDLPIIYIPKFISRNIYNIHTPSKFKSVFSETSAVLNFQFKVKVFLGNSWVTADRLLRWMLVHYFVKLFIDSISQNN